MNAIRRPTPQTLQDPKQALDCLTAMYEALVALRAPATKATYASFVVVGSNGSGFVALPPVRGTNGKILQQATVGSRVIAVVDLSVFNDNQTLFESVISTPNQIKQISPANLSAVTHLVLLVN